MSVSSTEADIRYNELMEEYISLTDSGKLSDEKEASLFDQMDGLWWDMSDEGRKASSDRMNHWCRNKA